MNKKYISLYILGMRVDMVQISGCLEMMEDWIIHKSYGHDIAVVNAYDAVSCKNDFMVKDAVNNSSLVVPDGISLILLARLHGFSLKKRVYGPDLMLEFLKIADKKGYSSFFYGSTDEVQKKLIANLKSQFPNMKVAGCYAPPFRALTSNEEEEIIAEINKSSPDILWVGLGCPKQQLWMYRHKDELKVPVMVGVGAAFDFFAKTKSQAPHWVRDSGFEWLFRLLTEPKRLWKRYLVSGSQFIYYATRELVLSRMKRK
jgi:N-acetylglucosaminyldiphosphoundecaprenol N-acetyl-beta-D-mannosaminyltransferase